MTMLLETMGQIKSMQDGQQFLEFGVALEHGAIMVLEYDTSPTLKYESQVKGPL